MTAVQTRIGALYGRPLRTITFIAVLRKGGKMGTANDYTHTEGEGKSITYNSSIQSTIGQQKIKGQSTKSDTIYRADAIKAIEDMLDCYNGFSITFDKAQIIEVLEDVPKAETVTKCKDCRYWSKDEQYATKGFCRIWHQGRKSKEYCSEGRAEK